MKLFFSLLTAAAILTGCGSMKPEDFDGRTPELDLFAYFSGQTRASGLFEDRFGKVRRQFTVDIIGRVSDDTLVLEEDFIYDDGERARRVWTIERTGDRTYRGRAGDVVGEAEGQVRGNALNWTYQMDLKVGDDTWRVTFDDWMFLQPDGVLLNRAWITRFGIEIGSVTLSFRKVLPAEQQVQNL